MCVCVCYFAARFFLRWQRIKQWKLQYASTAWHSTTAKLALRLCYLVTAWCAHLDGRHLSAIESPAKSKLITTNYLSPWKLHLYYKIDSYLKSQEQEHQSIAALALARCLDHWWWSNLCMCSLSSVYIAYSHWVQGCIDLLLLLVCMYACSKYGNSYIQCAWGGCNHHRGNSTIVLFIFTVLVTLGGITLSVSFCVFCFCTKKLSSKKDDQV